MRQLSSLKCGKAILLGFIAIPAIASGPPPETAPPDAAPRSAQESAMEKEAQLQLKAAGTSTAKVVNSAAHEGETAITALNISGVDHTVGAYMRWDAANLRWRVRTAKSTNLSTWTHLLPGIPSGYTESVDPVLDNNPYTTGVAPLRTYLGGLTYATDATGKRIKPEAVVVWRSTDGGSSWSTPVKVEENVSDNTYSLDKPEVAVSWYNQAPSTRGWLFVTYVRVAGTQAKLMVAKSTDGGVTFGAPVQAAIGKIHAPQIFVSSATGRVYVVYVDFAAGAIKVAISTNNGSTWSTETAATASGALLDPFVSGSPHINGSASCKVWAVTIPSARYNWVTDSIGVVWHERETTSPTSPTTVWFAAKTAAGWQPKKQLTAGKVGDQWHPALDFNSAGTWLVAYHDRSNDPANRYFRQAWVQTDHLGNQTGSGFVFNPFDTDPAIFQETPTSVCFRGDYQEVWFWPYASGGRYQVFWAGNPVSSGAFHDIYLSTIQ